MRIRLRTIRRRPGLRLREDVHLLVLWLSPLVSLILPSEYTPSPSNMLPHQCIVLFSVLPRRWTVAILCRFRLSMHIVDRQ